MSNTAFSKNLRKLREDNKISQKSAASNLKISQALLSHYEKGIRECGLDFLTRAAEFYKVSTDFMLGVSETAVTDCQINKTKSKTKIKDDVFIKNGREVNIYAALYKNLLVNAISYIFDGMKEKEHKEISVISGKYISAAVYFLYQMLNGLSDEKNPLGNYNFENQYLNIIINGIDIKI